MADVRREFAKRFCGGREYGVDNFIYHRVAGNKDILQGKVLPDFADIGILHSLCRSSDMGIVESGVSVEAQANDNAIIFLVGGFEFNQEL